MPDMTNHRSAELAQRLSTLNQEILDFVERCPDSVWRAPCPDDGRSVGVVAHHIASSYPLLVQVVELVANGAPIPPITQEQLDHANAEHAIQHAQCTSEEVAHLLRTHGAAATATVSRLTDAQLDRLSQGELFGMQMSTQQVIELVLLGHTQLHFDRLRL
jgi:uncharacterized damage-inducible protein DinB